MVTIAEFFRWIVYRVSGLYYRMAGALMSRDRLVLGRERKFRALLEAAPDAMVIVNSHGHIALVNAQTERLFKYERRQIIGQRIDELIPRRFRARHRQHLKGYMKDPTVRGMGTNLDLRGLRGDGSEFPIEISLSPLETDEGLLVSAAIRDITERKRAEEQLQYLADHDPLTGLLNRRSFEQLLRREVALANRSNRDGMMLLIDVDGLKDVNDTLGHAQGDELLRSMAELIAGRLRETDVVARLGGDEFGVLMPDTGPESAREVALELLRQIRDYGIVLGAQRLRPSACAGIASFKQGVDAVAEVMVAADLALYQAKERGRGQVSVYLPEAADQAAGKARTAWSQRIRHALDEDLFVPYRQPIASVPSGEVTRYELLVRLLDENGRPVPPAAFLATAERAGMVAEIDRKMAASAIELIRESQDRGEPICYEVNLSARSLADRGLTDFISSRLAETEVDPSLLVFEITETAAIANIDQARKTASTLRDVGCRFALDDFGAGFASFLYLKHIPLDALKIDGDFVRNLCTNPTDQLLVKHMVEIANSLGLYTIAEYVENEETLQILSGYGIDAVQGYHLGRPEPARKADAASVPERAPAAIEQGDPLAR